MVGVVRETEFRGSAANAGRPIGKRATVRRSTADIVDVMNTDHTDGEEPRSTACHLAVFIGIDVACFPLPSTGRLTIGRAEENDVRIDHASVSRRHAMLHIGTSLRVEDLGSANGVLLGPDAPSTDSNATEEQRRISNGSAEIAIGERFNVGSALLVVRRGAVEAATPDGGSPRKASVLQAGVVVRADAMRELYELARRAAGTPISILILGETGAGKEVIANEIHKSSPRSRKPFLGLNCATLAETLLENELFGHERGAYTGAVEASPGLFEAAHGGTVFLDEVGELPMSTQAKLLRVIEERRVMRIGARTPRDVDVRFIAATNRDLEAAVLRNEFRRDLFFRLNGLTLTIPPLRERVVEIEPLARIFMGRACDQMDRPHLALSDEFIEALRRYEWPGNVREMKNVIELSVLLCTGDELLAEHLPKKVTAQASVLSPAAVERASTIPTPGGARPAAPLRAEIDELERQRITEALAACGGNQTHAAERLGMSRRTLVSRLSEFNLPRPRRRS